jgi:hypothetical protein
VSPTVAAVLVMLFAVALWLAAMAYQNSLPPALFGAMLLLAFLAAAAAVMRVGMPP